MSNVIEKIFFGLGFVNLATTSKETEHDENIVTASVAQREKVPQYARVLATLGFSLNFTLTF